MFHSKCMYVLAYNIKHTISVANLWRAHLRVEIYTIKSWHIIENLIKWWNSKQNKTKAYNIHKDYKNNWSFILFSPSRDQTLWFKVSDSKKYSVHVHERGIVHLSEAGWDFLKEAVDLLSAFRVKMTVQWWLVL